MDSKTHFQEIVHLYKTVFAQHVHIEDRIKKIREKYNELISDNKRKIYLFCLDSFYFQYKILRMENENLEKMIKMINNRMYADYYKLHNIIIQQCKEHFIKIHSENTKFPHYKDLEPFHEYKIESIVEMHQEIIRIINEMNDIYLENQKKIYEYNEKTTMGPLINNFLDTLDYENMLLKDQIELYTNYMLFFHRAQRNYLEKIALKLERFSRELEEEVFINPRQGFQSLGENPVEMLMETIIPEKEKEKEKEETIITEKEKEKQETIVPENTNDIDIVEPVDYKSVPVLENVEP